MQCPRSAARCRDLARVLAAAAVAGVSGVAAAETDFTGIGQVYCVAERVTRCTAPGKCTTRAVSAKHKAEVLQIDFLSKSVLVRGAEDWRWMGLVAGDKVENGSRRIVVTWESGADARTLNMTLARNGRLSIDYGGGVSAEATCSAAP